MSQQYGYGGQQNPYAQQGGGLPSGPRAGGPPGGGFRQEYNAPPADNGYGAQSPTYGAQTMGRDDYGGRSTVMASHEPGADARTGQNVEMAPLAQNGQRFAGGSGDPNAILNECREIDRGIDAIEQNLERLKMLQQQSLNDPDSSLNSQTNRQLDAMSSETMTLYRNFAGRIKTIKQQPESGAPKNAPQVGKVDRKLKAAINKYQNVESDFRKKMQEQMARQYRIVRPDASEAEVREAVEDTSNQQVFSQALLQSDRQGQSRAALSAVEDRHKAIQKIESQMIELAELFQDMEALVVQQEAAVTQIEMKGEEVVDNMDKGTQEIGTAIKSARARNRKKWWCLGICVAIIIIIVIVVLIYKFVIQDNGSSNTTTNNNNAKRGLGALFHEEHRVVSSHTGNSKRIVVPGLEWKGSKLVQAGSGSLKPRMVIPGVDWTPPSSRIVRPGVDYDGGAALPSVE
ncbi:syntaxin 1b 2 3 [Phlyctema vagabunda]|uniref:Syntaxin 1b 2 3 n=1 Tax=Phlyctema vagabunda TaxID=108571 RepID=A0ABR4P941_9HELO